MSQGKLKAMREREREKIKANDDKYLFSLLLPFVPRQRSVVVKSEFLWP
jgi:hypothetical protein